MKLIMLRCPACGNALAPGDDDLIVGCAQCGAAVELGDEGLQPIEVRYTAPNAKGDHQWRPWWVFTGRVEIARRETQGGNQRDEALRFWSQVKRLYIPAWELSLQAVRDAGLKMLTAQPPLQAVPRPAGASLVPAVVSASDARQLLEYLVLTVEAGRNDWLKDLQFVVEVGSPELWAIS